MKVLADVGDATAATVMVGSMLGYLPALAALFTIVWTGIRIYEWWKGRKTSE